MFYVPLYTYKSSVTSATGAFAHGDLTNLRRSRTMEVWPKPANQTLLGGGFNYFLFSPLFAEDFQFD